MKRTEEFRFGDLYCGAGGMTTGVVGACKRAGVKYRALVVNHWPVAIATHERNHPDITHYCQTLASVEPKKAVPEGRLHLLCAAPECIHHSNARGGKPMSDQSRSSAWDVLKWCEQLYVDNLLIENVREFREWGPLNAKGRPIEADKGKLYQQFLRTLRNMGYTVDDRVLNAAHFGDATSRQRLFIQATRTGRRLNWPDPTHGPDPDLFGSVVKWRTAREIIDWSLPSQSIYKRKKPLCENTMRRIMAGLKKYSGLAFVIGQQSCAAPRHTDDPLPTIATAGAISLVEPYLVVLRNNCEASGMDQPAPTFCAGGNHVALVEPFLVPYYTEHKGEKPRVCSVDEPVDTLSTENRLGLAQPYLVKFNGTGGAQSVHDPLDTVTVKDRFGLVEPEVQMAYLDIRFRMLQPHELSAAMGFPSNYQFTGKRRDKVKQIGNAVGVNMAGSLAGAVLERMGLCA